MNTELKEQKRDELIEFISDPRFSNFIKEIEEQPDETRLAFAKKVARVETLKERGLKIPDGFKITLRTFEGEIIRDEFEKSSRELTKGGGWSVCIGTVITIGYQF